jgi:PAS domain S-box-containing protein
MSQHATRSHPLVEEFIKSESFALKVLNASLNGLYILDVKLGQIVFINTQYTKLTGYAFEDLQAMDRSQFFELFHPDDRRRIDEHIERLVQKSDELLEIEYRFKTKDGRWIWCLSRDSAFTCNDDASVSQLIGTFFDITERKLAEDKLRESETQLAAVLENLPVGVWIVDSTGRVTAKNNAADLIWRGDAPLSSRPENYAEYIAWDVETGRRLETDDYPLTRTLRTGLPIIPIELRIRRIDGTEGFIMMASTPLRGPDGLITGAVGINVDITDRKRAEETLREINKELNEFAYALDHTLKAPLRAIKNYVNFLFEDLAKTLEGEPKTYLEGIKKAVTQSNKHFEGLETLYCIRNHPVNLESFEMRELLDEIQSLFKNTSDRKLIIARDWPFLSGERFLLRQILIDLINNGFKFNRADIKRVEVGWQQAAGNRIEIFVRDNGIGIDPQYQQQIFDIFKRLHTEREYEGTGIGLAIVKRAVQKIGGKLRMESAVDKGSTFYISLPSSLLENDKVK